MFDDFYKGKRVLVTGETGFKGSWLSIWLRELGADVTGYSIGPPSKPNQFESCSLGERIQSVHGDIRDKDRLRRVMTERRPQIVFHLAAQAVVRVSYEEPERTFETNAMGTANLLEAVRHTPDVKVVINVTSDKCYENREWIWGYRESDPLGGRDPYSGSKACAEIIFSAYLHSFLVPAAIGAASVRAGNVIGGGDWGRDRLVPDCIRAWSSGETVRIRMPGAVRPWQHVLEPLSGYLYLASLLWRAPQRYSGPWNFGAGSAEGVAVRQVVTQMSELWGSGKWEEKSMDKDPHEANSLLICTDKANRELGWKCLLHFSQALRMTIEWYKRFYGGKTRPCMYEACCRQIQEYSEKARNAGLPWAM
ncbi:MAG: CDP-glucose 4,6-dehydratase [Desulfobacteraceae bacterium]|nr:MAG: CDP-glucose 4,6-dehydratase [Desulfobacteraceae bacterium]